MEARVVGEQVGLVQYGLGEAVHVAPSSRLVGHVVTPTPSARNTGRHKACPYDCGGEGTGGSRSATANSRSGRDAGASVSPRRCTLCWA